VVWSGLRGGLSFPLHQVRSLLPVQEWDRGHATASARPGLAAISFHACVNVNTTDATTVCFQHVLHVNWLLKYSAASSETLSFH